jgi:hypothetical protein
VVWYAGLLCHRIVTWLTFVCDPSLYNDGSI